MDSLKRFSHVRTYVGYCTGWTDPDSSNPAEFDFDGLSVRWATDDPETRGDEIWVTMHVFARNSKTESDDDAPFVVDISIRTVLAEQVPGSSPGKYELLSFALPFLAEKASDELARFSLALGLRPIQVAAASFRLPEPESYEEAGGGSGP